MPLFCRKGEFVAHIWEEKREKGKKNTAEEGEIVENREGERVGKWFFFEGLSGRVESEKRRDKRREEECGGVKSVYLPKESDSRLPANNPF